MIGSMVIPDTAIKLLKLTSVVFLHQVETRPKSEFGSNPYPFLLAWRLLQAFYVEPK